MKNSPFPRMHTNGKPQHEFRNLAITANEGTPAKNCC
jgi:hypothetical protein